MFRVFAISCIILLFLSCQSRPDLVVIETDFGSFTIKVDYPSAPQHAANFVNLVNDGFYDGLTFQRIIGSTLIESGEPDIKYNDQIKNGDYSPNDTLDNEFGLRNVRGAVGAACITGPDDHLDKFIGSQFYICLENIPIWDGVCSVFGNVIENMDVVEKISLEPIDLYNSPKQPIYIRRAYLK